MDRYQSLRSAQGTQSSNSSDASRQLFERSCSINEQQSEAAAPAAAAAPRNPSESSEKGCGLATALSLSCIGLVIAVVSAKENHRRDVGKLHEDTWMLWFCSSVKSLFLLAGSCSLICLHRAMRQQPQLPEAADAGRLHFPSGFLTVALLLFGFCGVAACCSEAAFCMRDLIVEGRRFLAMEFTKFLLNSVFIVLQIFFVHRNKRKLALSQPTLVTMLMSLVLAVNASCWVFSVGYEVSHVVSKQSTLTGSSSISGSSKDNSTLQLLREAVEQTLYPLEIEFYVMGSLLAFLFVGNVRKSPNFSEDAARSQHQRSSCFRFQLAAAVLLVAAAVSVVFVSKRMLAGSIDPDFLWIPIMTHIVCVVLCILSLLRLRAATAGRRLPPIDAALLWLGVAAIIVNDFYTVCRSCEQLVAKSEKRTKWLLLLASSCVNMPQSVLQASILLLMPLPLPPLPPSLKRLLFCLMLLNGVEWLIYTSFFPLLFPFSKWDEGLVISMIAIPLLVFFRLHCVGCFSEVADVGCWHCWLRRRCCRGRAEDAAEEEQRLIHRSEDS